MKECIDLRPICRPSDVETLISVRGYDGFTWLKATEVQIVDSGKGRWTVSSRMHNASDKEGDAAYAFSIVISQPTFEMVTYGITHLSCFVVGDLDDFRVEKPGVDPRIGAPRLKKMGRTAIVRYLPAPDVTHYREMLGRHLTIYTGIKGA